MLCVGSVYVDMIVEGLPATRGVVGELEKLIPIIVKRDYTRGPLGKLETLKLTSCANGDGASDTYLQGVRDPLLSVTCLQPYSPPPAIREARAKAKARAVQARYGKGGGSSPR